MKKKTIIAETLNVGFGGFFPGFVSCWFDWGWCVSVSCSMVFDGFGLRPHCVLPCVVEVVQAN